MPPAPSSRRPSPASATVSDEASAADGGAAPRVVVLDTNAALDVVLFDDARAARLATALANGTLHWHATERMLDELATVLRRPFAAARAHRADDALAVARARCTVVAPPSLPPRGLPPFAGPWPPARWRCRDADDQIFVDLALALRPCTLVSHDRAVLALARALRPFGVAVVRPGQTTPGDDAARGPAAPACGG